MEKSAAHVEFEARLRTLDSNDGFGQPDRQEPPTDILTDFEKGVARLDPVIAERLRERQRSVARKTRQAGVDSDLLNMRIG